MILTTANGTYSWSSHLLTLIFRNGLTSYDSDHDTFYVMILTQPLFGTNQQLCAPCFQVHSENGRMAVDWMIHTMHMLYIIFPKWD